MTLQPNLIPSTQRLAYQTSTPDGVTLQSQTRRSRINQPWFWKGAGQSYQTATSTGSFGNLFQIGIDTIQPNSNTYNPTNNPTYNLTYDDVVLGGNDYPYSGINLPNAGVYLTYVSATVTIGGSISNLFSFYATIEDPEGNSSGSTSLVGTFSGAINGGVVEATDYFYGNVGDTITYYINLTDAGMTGQTVTIACNAAAIRYLGQS